MLRVLLLLALIGPTVRGQEEEALRPGVHEYLEIVQTYRAGEVAASIDALVKLPEKDIEDATRDLAADDAQVAEPVALAAACALHLELMQRDARPDLERTHLAAVLRLLRKVRRTSLVDETLGVDIHLATAWFLQDHLLLTPLRDLLEALELSFPNDPRVALTIGTVHETLASRRLEAGRRAGLAPDAEESLKKAEAQFRHALQLDPRLAEAHLRLGRVLQTTGKADAALRAADQALATAGATRDVRYLAQLLRAAILQPRDRDAAIAALDQAGKECACCSVPVLARSRILFDRGSTEAAPALAEALRPRESGDPWVWYDFGQSGQLGDLMASLRERLR